MGCPGSASIDGRANKWRAGRGCELGRYTRGAHGR